MLLAWQAKSPNSAVSSVLPAAVGAAPLMLGYLACDFASRRLSRAIALES
jgi:hypothetical protein